MSHIGPESITLAIMISSEDWLFENHALIFFRLAQKENNMRKKPKKEQSLKKTSNQNKQQKIPK